LTTIAEKGGIAVDAILKKKGDNGSNLKILNTNAKAHGLILESEGRFTLTERGVRILDAAKKQLLNLPLRAGTKEG
jgi:hypothetical protein